MTYATKQNLIDRFSARELQQLTDRDGTVDAIDDTVLGGALDDADAEIEGYLVGRYVLPLATVPRLLVNVACDIARYRLYDDRATEQVTKRYDDAVRLLKSLAKGEISLGLDTLGQATPEAGGVQVTANERVFSAGLLGDY